MSDLISRAEAIKTVKFYESFCDPYPRVIESLEKLPSAQPNNECEKCVFSPFKQFRQTAQLEQRWIPCGERLPKQGQEVICQCRASIIKVLKLDVDGDWYQDVEHCYMSGFVIAWMPLPDAYEEDD